MASIITRVRIVLAVIATLLFVVPAVAGQQTGTVAMLLVRQSDGMVYFYLDGTATGKPACATNAYWMIKDENSNAGKQMLAMLLAARAQGQAITVVGNNTCTRWSDGEDVDQIRF